MEIIQQLIQELVEKVLKKATSQKIADIDALSSELLEDCKICSRGLVQEILSFMNEEIRGNKARRKSKSLVIKEKDRPRTLLTELGELNFTRDYYYNKQYKTYMYLLDGMIGLRSYERIGDTISAKLTSLATKHSYAESAALASGKAVSRQTVRNKILESNLEELPPKFEKKRVEELHVYADEDHIHMQKPKKRRGKKSRIAPLVTVTEGVIAVDSRRNKTVEARYFVDEHFNTQALWKDVEGYIDMAYDVDSLKHIYIHGDGGNWIKSGLEVFDPAEHVMDGFHFEKQLKSLIGKLPASNLREKLVTAIQADEKKQVTKIRKKLNGVCETEKQQRAVSEWFSYLSGNWEAIRKYLLGEGGGSCTEGQVSHVLSERFSRDPLGWSEAGLGKLMKARVLVLNGGKITADAFKRESPYKDMYKKYADQVIEDVVNRKLDWSIFEGSPFIMDGASGTRNAIRSLGKTRKWMS